MAIPKETLWPLEPHTLGKHRVLKSYLDAWDSPLWVKRNRRILFIGGFGIKDPKERKDFFYGLYKKPQVKLSAHTSPQVHGSRDWMNNAGHRWTERQSGEYHHTTGRAPPSAVVETG